MSKQPARPCLVRVAGTLALVCTAVVLSAKVRIDVLHDPEFDFRPLKTFAWHPDGAGEVKVLVKYGGDPVKLRERFEPVINRWLSRSCPRRA